MTKFLKVKKHFILVFMFFIMIALAQEIQPVSPKKNSGKYDFRLVWLVDRLGEFLSGKIPLTKASILFISSKDLEFLGIMHENVKKVSERILKEKLKFEEIIKKYNIRNKNKMHFMKSIELEDAEYIPFMKDKNQNSGKMLLALKGVTIYYQAMGSGGSSPSNIAVKIPAIFLLKDRWRISELEGISELNDKVKY